MGAATACSIVTTNRPASVPDGASPAILVGPRQAEAVLGKIREAEAGRGRRCLVAPRFAELASHVVFLRESEAAMGLHAGIGGRPRRIGRKHLGHIGLGA